MKRYISLVIGVFAVDRITKFLISITLPLNSSKRVIGNFMRFTHIENPYGVWGVRVVPSSAFLILTVLACLILVYFLIRTKNLSLALILGGALGNLTDRIGTGRVTDFLDFGIGTMRWPVFNIADSCITVGIILFIITSAKRKDKETRR
jgi:signal peptidase II